MHLPRLLLSPITSRPPVSAATPVRLTTVTSASPIVLHWLIDFPAIHLAHRTPAAFTAPALTLAAFLGSVGHIAFSRHQLH